VASWWAARIRQFGSHVRACVTDAEREALENWLTPQQAELFDAMPVADRRHGLDVVASLRSSGETDHELLLAGLLHDAGKGRAVGLWPRVAFSLGERYGSWVWRVSRPLPGFRVALDRLRDHAERSAALATDAGCSQRTVELIRHQSEPLDRDGAVLRLADEAN
jgi:hypothetical protein